MKKLLLGLLVITLLACGQTKNTNQVFDDYYSVESSELDDVNQRGLMLEFKALQNHKSYSLIVSVDDGTLISINDQVLGTLALYDYESMSVIVEPDVRKCGVKIVIKDEDTRITQADYSIVEVDGQYKLMQIVLTEK